MKEPPASGAIKTVNFPGSRTFTDVTGWKRLPLGCGVDEALGHFDLLGIEPQELVNSSTTLWLGFEADGAKGRAEFAGDPSRRALQRLVFIRSDLDLETAVLQLGTLSHDYGHPTSRKDRGRLSFEYEWTNDHVALTARLAPSGQTYTVTESWELLEPQKRR